MSKIPPLLPFFLSQEWDILSLISFIPLFDVNSRRPILEKRTSFLYKSAEDWYDGEGRYRLRILPEGD